MSVLDRVQWVIAVAPGVAMTLAMLTAAATIGAHTIVEQARRRVGRRTHTKEKTSRVSR